MRAISAASAVIAVTLATTWSGKIVVAFLEYGGDREYYLASAADRVFLLPTSALDLTGVARIMVARYFEPYEFFLTIGAAATSRHDLSLWDDEDEFRATPSPAVRVELTQVKEFGRSAKDLGAV